MFTMHQAEVITHWRFKIVTVHLKKLQRYKRPSSGNSKGAVGVPWRTPDNGKTKVEQMTHKIVMLTGDMMILSTSAPGMAKTFEPIELLTRLTCIGRSLVATLTLLGQFPAEIDEVNLKLFIVRIPLDVIMLQCD